MMPWFILLIALISTLVCLFLWFRDTRRIMQERMSTVESAARQLLVYQEKASNAQSDREIAEVLIRSRKIYRQALECYNQTLQKPWNYLPARAMGFHLIRKDTNPVESNKTQ